MRQEAAVAGDVFRQLRSAVRFGLVGVDTRHVTVRFAAPASGVDPETGESFESTLHRVHAERLLQDASSSIFISELGEVVAEWPTQLVVSVKWGHQVGPDALDPPDEATQKREPSLTELKAQLERWRSDLAQRQNARSSSILSNAAIDEIIDALPRSRRELKSLRSVQPNQWRKHWKEILQIIDDAFSAASTGPASMDSAIGKDQSLSAESADSLPKAVHRHFNISVSAYGRFENPGWFHVGTTVADCPSCREPLEGFRRPYTAGGKTYHYWALICLGCNSMRQPAELDQKARLELYASSELRPYPND